MSLDVNISEPDEFNCIELHDSIKKVAKMKEFDEFSYHVDVVCGNGTNYIANVFRVLINDSSSDKKESVIVKTLINIERKGLFSELHYREVNAYDTIINEFISIQNILDESVRITLPECLISNIDKGKEVIILEDLLLRGFGLNDKILAYENIDYSKVEQIIIYLSKFHALSFIYERKQDTQSFIKLKKDFIDIVYQDTFLDKSLLRNYFVESFEMSMNFIEDTTTRKKLGQIKKKLLELLKMYTSTKKYNAFCHGDCWLNNILLNETSEDVCFVDFQTMRYANPVTDILHFLYISTDSKFRSENLDTLKKCYYTNFKNFLKLFDLESSDFYPEEEYTKDFANYLPYGLIVALIELRVATTNPDDEAVLRKVANSNDHDKEDIEVLNLYQMRVKDVCNESEQNGVLDKLVDLVNNL